MKPLVLIAALSLVAAPAEAGPVAWDIQHYLGSCRAETSTPFVKSSSRSGFYLVGKTGGRYHINIAIQLRYPAHFSDQDFARARDKFEAVKRWITRYYRDYGLHPDIQLDHARYDPSASNPHPTPPEHSFVVSSGSTPART